MAGVQLFARNVLAFALFVQSSQGYNFGCSEGECDAELTMGSTVFEHSDRIVGYMCTSKCRQAGYSYYWCDADWIKIHKEGSEVWSDGWPSRKDHPWKWDYCSPRSGTDIKGNWCASNHYCGEHGYKYRWCYTNTEHTKWNLCGMRVTVKMPKYFKHCHDVTKNKYNEFCDD